MDRDIRMLCEWKDVEVLELNILADHIHAVFSIPPKIAISTFMGFLKGKLAGLIDYLEAGDSLDVFLAQFPNVSREHAVAVLELAKRALTAPAA